MFFKRCPCCGTEWGDRNVFLSDPEVALSGYQVHFVRLTAGLFLFQHERPGCGTTIALPVEEIVDLYDGPVFNQRTAGSDACPGYCLQQGNLMGCPVECECAFVRQILTTIRNWPKRPR